MKRQFLLAAAVALILCPAAANASFTSLIDTIDDRGVLGFLGDKAVEVFNEKVVQPFQSETGDFLLGSELSERAGLFHGFVDRTIGSFTDFFTNEFGDFNAGATSFDDSGFESLSLDAINDGIRTAWDINAPRELREIVEGAESFANDVVTTVEGVFDDARWMADRARELELPAPDATAWLADLTGIGVEQIGDGLETAADAIEGLVHDAAQWAGVDDPAAPLEDLFDEDEWLGELGMDLSSPDGFLASDGLAIDRVAQAVDAATDRTLAAATAPRVADTAFLPGANRPRPPVRGLTPSPGIGMASTAFQGNGLPQTGSMLSLCNEVARLGSMTHAECARIVHQFGSDPAARRALQQVLGNKAATDLTRGLRNQFSPPRVQIPSWSGNFTPPQQQAPAWRRPANCGTGPHSGCAE